MVFAVVRLRIPDAVNPRGSCYVGSIPCLEACGVSLKDNAARRDSFKQRVVGDGNVILRFHC